MLTVFHLLRRYNTTIKTFLHALFLPICGYKMWAGIQNGSCASSNCLSWNILCPRKHCLFFDGTIQFNNFLLIYMALSAIRLNPCHVTFYRWKVNFRSSSVTMVRVVVDSESIPGTVFLILEYILAVMPMKGGRKPEEPRGNPEGHKGNMRNSK